MCSVILVLFGLISQPFHLSTSFWGTWWGPVGRLNEWASLSAISDWLLVVERVIPQYETWIHWFGSNMIEVAEKAWSKKMVLSWTSTLEPAWWMISADLVFFLARAFSIWGYLIVVELFVWSVWMIHPRIDGKRKCCLLQSGPSLPILFVFFGRLSVWSDHVSFHWNERYPRRKEWTRAKCKRKVWWGLARIMEWVLKGPLLGSLRLSSFVGFKDRLLSR